MCNKCIRHKIHVVGDDFTITHEGILGADFLKRHVTHWEYPTKRLTIGETTFKLFPYKKITLAPQSETVVQATTSENALGVVHVLETRPGVIIGGCLVNASDYSCPVSVINTTDEEIEIQAPHVDIE